MQDMHINTYLNNFDADGNAIDDLINRAIAEDIRTGDVTTNAIISDDQKAEAFWVAKESGVIAGLEVGRKVFERMDPDLKWIPVVTDGDTVTEGTQLVTIKGDCRALLTAERIALNIVQRMCGIATKTARFVTAIKSTSAKILDTRKTVPGLRMLDKYSVAAGGGENHRMGLYDMAMIKDNHILAAGGISEAVTAVKRNAPRIKIEVETTNLKEVKEALSAGVDIIMLDNMSPQMMKEAVNFVDARAKTEASGNITHENVREVANTGVDYISVGALTHSVNAFDISQKFKN